MSFVRKVSVQAVQAETVCSPQTDRQEGCRYEYKKRQEFSRNERNKGQKEHTMLSYPQLFHKQPYRIIVSENFDAAR